MAIDQLTIAIMVVARHILEIPRAIASNLMEVALEAAVASAAARVTDTTVLNLHLQAKGQSSITTHLLFTLLRRHLSPKNKKRNAFNFQERIK